MTDFTSAIIDAVGGDPTARTGMAGLSTSLAQVIARIQVIEAAFRTLSFSAATYSVPEGNSGTTTLTATMKRTGDLTQPLAVTTKFIQGTLNAADFPNGLPGDLIFYFAAGSDTAQAGDQIKGDVDLEATETLTRIIIPAPGYSYGPIASYTGNVLNDDTSDPVIAYTAWPYTDDLESAAEGSDILARPNWSATGNSTDRYKVGTYGSGKAVANGNIYRPDNYLVYGPDLNTDGSDFGFQVEIDENRSGNAGQTNGQAWAINNQRALIFYRDESNYLEVQPGTDGIVPSIVNNVIAGTGTRVGNTFRHLLQTPPASRPAGTASVTTMYEYSEGGLRVRLMDSGDWCLRADRSTYPFDYAEVNKIANLTDVATRHGAVAYRNSAFTYPLLNGIRVRPLRMKITSHARYCSRTTATSGIGKIWVRGKYKGTAASWAYRLWSKPGNTIVQGWKTPSNIVTDTSAGTFSLDCIIPQGGPYEIELAMTDSDGKVHNTWTKRVACGRFYITNGQSNSGGRQTGVSDLTTFSPLAACTPVRSANNTEGIPDYEMSGMGTAEFGFPANVEMSRIIADATGVPCLVISTGIGGSGAAYIFGDGYALSFAPTRARIDGWVDGVLWDQGEGDRDGVYSPDGYYDTLKAGYLKMVDTSGNPNLPMWISPIGNFPRADPPNNLTSWTNVDKYARVIKLAYERLIAEYPGKIAYADSKLGQVHADNDPYHYKSVQASGYPSMSRRAGWTIAKALGVNVADGRGPIPNALARAGAVLTLSMDMNGSTGLTDLVTSSTINTDGKGVPALAGALYGYEVSADDFASLLTINSIERSGNTLVITLAADPGKPVKLRSFHGASYEDRYLFWGTYPNGRNNIPVAPIINYLTSN